MRYAGHMKDVVDFGSQPFVVNIEDATEENNFFRRALWTGEYLQLTLMSIPPGGEIGLELHPETDQFLRLEEGHGMVKMGACKEWLDYQQQIRSGDVILVPAGTWHNIINTGREPLKIYSIYAPPHHPHGTVDFTKADADARVD